MQRLIKVLNSGIFTLYLLKVKRRLVMQKPIYCIQNRTISIKYEPFCHSPPLSKELNNDVLDFYLLVDRTETILQNWRTWTNCVIVLPCDSPRSLWHISRMLVRYGSALPSPVTVRPLRRTRWWSRRHLATRAREGPGLVTNSILFCWLFKIKDRCKKVRF